MFGTCVDWRGSIARAGSELSARRRLPEVDWHAFADDWRRRYQPQLETVRSGARPWVVLDVLHREALDELLPLHGLGDLPEEDREALTVAWHALDPWPDVVPGLTRLKERFIVAPCSNGHIALIVNMARRAGLPWDVVLGAEVARAYKPQPDAYLRSVRALGLEPGQAMMVAAHNDDLRAAAALGLRTAFVARPSEWGPAQRSDLDADADVDLAVSDLEELAGRLA